MNDIETIRKEGVQESDLNKVKETRVQSRTKDLKENRWWMGNIQGVYMDGWNSFDNFSLESYQSIIESITPAEIQETIKQYYNDENFIRIVMNPEPAESN